jgi:TRAP-type C4-dicarboxylate transport system permease small subunit
MKAAKVFRGVDQFIEALDPPLVTLGLTALMISAGMLFSGMIFRYFFNQTITIFEDLSVNFIIWAVMLFGGPVFKRGGHVGMEFLAERLDARKKAVHQLVIYLFLLLICAIFVWKGGEIVRVLYQIGKTTQSGEIQVWYLMMPVPVGCLLYGIYGLAGIIKVLCALSDPTIAAQALSAHAMAPEETDGLVK